MIADEVARAAYRLAVIAMLILIFVRLGDVVDGVRYFDARVTNIEAAK